MALDTTASMAENIVLNEALSLTFSPDNRKVAVATRMFYSKGFVLFSKCPNENFRMLVRDVDYRLLFKIPGLRDETGIHSVYAAIELLTYEPDAAYGINYRALGETATYDKDDLRRHFERNYSFERICFHALIKSNNTIPTVEELADPQNPIMLIPSTIDYRSHLGLVEMAADQAGLNAMVEHTDVTGGGDSGTVSDGGMF